MGLPLQEELKRDVDQLNSRNKRLELEVNRGKVLRNPHMSQQDIEGLMGREVRQLACRCVTQPQQEHCVHIFISVRTFLGLFLQTGMIT